MISSLERARSFLREQESEYRGQMAATEIVEQAFDRVEEDVLPAEPVPVWAEQWVYVRRASPAKQIILELSDLLEQVIELAAKSNLPEDQAALSNLERAQLIILLRTSLKVLEAPMVEPGILKKTRKTLEEAAQATVRKQAELALGNGASRLMELIAKLLQTLGG